jgi:hypothetical protein
MGAVPVYVNFTVTLTDAPAASGVLPGTVM